jgi:LPXTG-motif cell wall-anchored protein
MDTTVIWGLVIGIPVLALVGWLLFFRSRKPKIEPNHYFRCPGCKRKLKYLARQAGHKGMCSTCKEQFIFPVPAATHR